MSAIEHTISAGGRESPGRLRHILVAAVLVVGSVTGFGLGRATGSGGSTIAPAWPVTVVGDQGPGHVPRHWTDQFGRTCSPPGSRPVRCW